MPIRKLLRDKIPDLIEKDGDNRPTGTFTKKEYRAALFYKLLEEAEEANGTYLNNPEVDSNVDMARELGDLLEVVEAIIVEFDLHGDMVGREQRKKRAEKGGFSRHMWAEFD